MRIDFVKAVGIGLLAGAMLSACNEAQSSQETGEEVIESKMASHMSPGLYAENLWSESVPPSMTSEAAVAPPQPSVLEHLDAEPNLSLFAAAVKETDLDKDLGGTGPYTIFATPDTAFSALMADTTLSDLRLPENREHLKRLLNNHLVVGKIALTDLQDGTTLNTNGSQQLVVTKQNGQIFINDAALQATDEGCSNGVVHVVTKVLVPLPAS
ncbi:fasciclin domain-containing protein [Pontibacter sp. 13R65]|uniref:fasciclin domain-containing protein n=1 Tax=Pontibacter sp. 13R65 TaxID=3127458 RepID=UPI00301B8BE3